MEAKPQPHREAAKRHEEAAQRHEEARRFWLGYGDSERAELQRRGAELERQLAQLENDWAELLARRGR
jgi:hypothetical protein